VDPAKARGEDTPLTEPLSELFERNNAAPLPSSGRSKTSKAAAGAPFSGWRGS
jgi:hypothetical protein